MKREFKIILAVVIVGVAIGGAYATSRILTGQSNCQPSAPVLATFFPVYDFSRHIVADTTGISLLVPMTVDVHDFTPDACSIQQVASARVLIYSGAQPEPGSGRLKSGNNDDQRSSRVASRRESRRSPHLAGPSNRETTSKQYSSGPN